MSAAENYGVSDYLRDAEGKLIKEMIECRDMLDKGYMNSLKEHFMNDLGCQPMVMGEMSVAIDNLAKGLQYANELADQLKDKVNTLGEYSAINQDIGIKNLKSPGVTKIDNLRSLASDLDVLVNKIININTHLQQVV